MNSDSSENNETTVMNFVKDFFSSYDKNRHILHTMFAEDGTFIVLGNRISGHSAIQQVMLNMATTTHQVFSIDIQNIPIPLPENVSLYQVLCSGHVEFGGDPLVHGFTASLLVSFHNSTVLSVVSFNERCMWPKLS